MAANLKRRGIAYLGKRLICNQQSWTSHSTSSSVLSPAALTLKRTFHISFYEKNIDDLAHQAVVPDEVIQPQSDKYWAPHPQTGVFGPAVAHPATATSTATTTGERGFHSSLGAATANLAVIKLSQCWSRKLGSVLPALRTWRNPTICTDRLTVRLGISAIACHLSYCSCE